MLLLRIVFVAIGIFVLTAEARDLGSCKDCQCVRQECDHPQTQEECDACASAVQKQRTSMEGGYCWVLVGATSEGDCATRTFSKLTGCSGFVGYTHYGCANNNCWARWYPPVQVDENAVMF